MHIIVTHLGFKAVQNAKLRLAKNLQYADKVQLQDLKEQLSVLCYVPGNNMKTSHFVSLCCVLCVGYLKVFPFYLKKEMKVKLLSFMSVFP